MKNQAFSRLFALVMAVLMTVGALPIAVLADTSEFSYYTEYDENNVEYAVISGYYGGEASVVIPSEIDGYAVRAIGYGLFQWNGSVESVVLPEGITRIGGYAFAYSALKSITLPTTLLEIESGAFYQCCNLTDLLIPASVRKMGEAVFYELATDIRFEGSAVPEAWGSAWYDGCNANFLVGDDVYAGTETVGEWKYRFIGDDTTLLRYYGEGGCAVEFPGEVNGHRITAIGAYVFNEVESPTGIAFLAEIKRIERNAFAHCHRLESVTIPASVEYVGNWAFAYCYHLKEICCESETAHENWETDWYLNCDAAIYYGEEMFRGTVYSGDWKYTLVDGAATDVSYIGKGGKVTLPTELDGRQVVSFAYNIFWAQDLVTELVIPADCAYFGEDAIRCQNRLESITVEEGNTRYYSEGNCLMSYSDRLIVGCKNSVIPEGTKEIAERAFQSCYGLTEIVIPEGVTSIGFSAFAACENLEKITFPSTLTHVYYDAFDSCKALTELVIPATVTHMGYMGGGVFDNCYNLKTVYCEADSMPETWDANWLGSNKAAVYFGDTLYRGVCGDFAYSIDENGNAVIEKYIGEEDPEATVVIPSELDGRTVTTIGQRAFMYLTFKGITLPSTVTKLDHYAFQCCYATEIEIPDSVTFIGDYALSWLRFEVCRIPASVTYLGEGVFLDCFNMHTLYIEAESAPETWNTNWSMYCTGSIVFGACMHRNKTESREENTCTENGYYSLDCDDCGENLKYELYEASHDYDNGVCNRCGEQQPMSELYNYWIQSEGVYIERYYGDDEHVIIPSEIEGYPVYAIGSYAFNWNETVKSVVIPETVRSIGYAAFRRCSNLQSVTVKGALDFIDGYAFENCSSLTSVTLAEGTDRILYSAFYYCTSLKEIVIPASVTYVASGVFEGCNSLEAIYCLSGEYMEAWESDWATGCMADILVEGELLVDVEIAEDFILATQNGKVTVLKYTGDGTSVTVPAEWNGCPVTEIGVNAFRTCTQIRSLILPETIEVIGKFAFVECLSLKTLTIPASVVRVDNAIVSFCSSLTDIYCAADADFDSWETNWNEECFANIWRGDELYLGWIDGLRVDFSSGSAVILGYNGDATELVIPSELGGCPVTEIGSYAFQSGGTLQSVVLPETLAIIREYAFADCYNLTEITIPASVTELYSDVFANCVNLENIYCQSEKQPESWHEYWANGCSASIWFGGELAVGTVDGFRFEVVDGNAVIVSYRLSEGETELVVPSVLAGKTVIGIGERGLGDLYYLTSITLPDTIQWIGDYAFFNNNSMQSITLPAGLESIGRNAFEQCQSLPVVTIPDTVTEIGAYAFGWCYALTEITIPASVKTVGECLFYADNSLTDIYCLAETQPEGWSSECFAYFEGNVWFGGVLVRGVIDGFRIDATDGGVTVLDYVGDATEIVIPETLGGLPVTTIGRLAFAYTEDITSVIIPDTVTEIEEYAFEYCYGLTEITVPASVVTMGYGVFSRNDNLKNIYCEAQEKPDGWSRYWFEGCDANIWFGGVLSRGTFDGFEVTVEEGAVTILDYVGDATEIVIPGTLGDLPVTTIGSYAFAYLYSVTSVTIPDSVRVIANNAFYCMESLTEITIPVTVEQVHDSVFDGCNALQNIYCEVPARPDAWGEYWYGGCNANIWFDGVLSRGVIDGFRIRVEDGLATIERYLGSDSVLVIPETLGGATVYAVNGYAFEHNEYLTEVMIPLTVEVMNGEVFFGCENLKNIYCESSEQPELWNTAWANGCAALVWFDGVLKIGVEDGYRFEIADGEATIIDYVGSATELAIPETLGGYPVTVIGDYAFENIDTIQTVTVSATVTRIGSNAFAWCQNLVAITIPDSVLEMGYRIFDGSYALENIYCAASACPDGWSDEWKSGCGANIWFDGVMLSGVLDGFRFENNGGEVTILGYVGNATEIVVPDTLGGCPVTEIGDYAFGECYQLQGIVIPESVSVIGRRAFAYCHALTEITIPAGVEIMGSDVFRRCDALANIYCEAEAPGKDWSGSWVGECNASVYFAGKLMIGVVDGFRFENNDGEVIILDYVGDAEAVVIPSEIGGVPVRSIGSNAFAGCYFVTGVTIPDSVTEIGYGAFASCEALTEITIPDSVEDMDNDIFADCYSLQRICCEAKEQPEGWNDRWSDGSHANVYFDGVLTIGTENGYRFEVCDGGVTVRDYFGDESTLVIPETLGGYPVIAIGEYAFAYDYRISCVVLPSTLKRIECCAFYEMDALCEAVLPEGLESIGDEAFCHNYTLKTITIPATVTEMGDNVFWNCGNLQSIYCASAAPAKGWSEGWHGDCEADIWFDGVLTVGWVGDYRIRGNNGKATVVRYRGNEITLIIPSEIGGFTVTEIGAGAFECNDAVQSVTIPMAVTRIGDNAFAWCPKLAEITIGDAVRTLGGRVFDGCVSLKNIYCEPSEKPEGWSDSWSYGCEANVYFDGVLTIGTVGDYRIMLENGTVTILRYVGNRDVTALAIPSELNGYPVCSIGEDAIASLKAVTDISIPDTVTRIGAFAFSDCCSLTEITIPASVTRMSWAVFDGCDALQNIYCEASEFPTGWDSDWMGYCNADVWLDGKPALVTEGDYRIKIEEEQVTILKYYGNESVLSVPSELCGYPVTRIAYGAFASNGSLVEVTIPATVKTVDNDLFWDCDSLKKVSLCTDGIPENWGYEWMGRNTASVYANGKLVYGVVDGWLMYVRGEEATILQSPESLAGEITVPSELGGYSVTEIGAYAFEYRYDVTGIILPDSIKTIGGYAFFENMALEYVLLPDGLERICNDAFGNCISLKTITIPASVTEMEYSVFGGCESLAYIYCEAKEPASGWSEGWYNRCNANVLFDGVLKLGVIDGFKVEFFEYGAVILDYLGGDKKLTVPSELGGVSVVEIAEYAFANLYEITEVTLPESLLRIGYEAFAYCESLTEITIPEGVLYMDSHIFTGCQSLQNIYCKASAQPEEWAYDWYEGCLATVWLGDVLFVGTEGDYRVRFNEDGVYILEYLGNAVELEIPSALGGVLVAGIEDGAFVMSDSLVSVTVPEGVRYIGYYAFSDCAYLETITVKGTLDHVGGGAFGGNTMLENIYFAPENHPEHWSSRWLDDCEADVNVWIGDELITVWDGDYRVLLVDGGASILAYRGKATVLSIPATLGGCPVVIIGTNAFLRNMALEAVLLPETLVRIDSLAFAYCESLKSVSLPQGLVAIGTRAFSGCILLESVSIPGTVRYLEDEAFSYCENLKTVILAEGLAEIGYGAFAVTGLTEIVFPQSLRAIDEYAFVRTALVEVFIPVGVEYVGEYAFAQSNSLTLIYCEASEQPSVWSLLWNADCNADTVWNYTPCLHEHTEQQSFAPECDLDGFDRVVCTDCGRTLEEVVYPATGHRYGKDGVCTRCKESTVDMVISVGNAHAKPGETFTVEVMLDHNTGFAYLSLEVLFDSEVMELVSVTNGQIIGNLTQGNLLVWADGFDSTATGTLCTLTFAVKEGAPDGKYALGVSVFECYGENEEDVSVACNDGTASVSESVFGDANGDGVVNGKDATRLLRYLASYDPSTGESAQTIDPGADVNGDGAVNGKDATRLLRYLASYDPTTGESDVTLGPTK